MISESLAALSAGDNISEQRSYNMMMEILDGTTSDEQNTQMLNALCSKGETDDEVSGMLRAMRQAVVPVKIDNTDAIDVCGTGGDGLQTVNISTAAMFVASSVGCSVAKHGNRSSSGAVGSADIFESLGCNLQEDADQIALCMEKTNVCFMFAPRHHPIICSEILSPADNAANDSEIISDPLQILQSCPISSCPRGSL